jgi:hypothetical protein
MPVFLLALGILAIILYSKYVQDTQTQVTETSEDMLKSDIQKSIERTQQQMVQAGFAPKNALQEAELKKWSAVATIAGTATATTIAAFSPLTLAAAGPIGAVVAGVIVAISFMRGTAHLVANEWVDRVQNPFGQAAGRIINENAQAMAAGTATIESVGYARQALASLWGNYRFVAEQFASLDRDHRTVIDQSYATLNPIMDAWMASLTKDMQTLSGRTYQMLPSGPGSYGYSTQTGYLQ